MKHIALFVSVLALSGAPASADVIFVEVRVNVGLSHLTRLTSNMDQLGPTVLRSYNPNTSWARTRTNVARHRSRLLRNRASIDPAVDGEAEQFATTNPLLQTSGDAGFAMEGFGGGPVIQPEGDGTAEGALIEMTEEDMMATLADVPDTALRVADALMSFSDRSIAFLASLRGLLAGRKIEWGKIMDGRRSLQARKARNLDSMGQNTRETETEEEARDAAFRRAVRSILKILLGITIGLSLWFVVRSM